MNNAPTIISGISQATRALIDEKNQSQAIQTAVTALGIGTNVDRCYVFQYEIHDGEEFLSQRFEWAKDSVSVQIDNPNLQMMPSTMFAWLSEALKKDEPLFGLVAESEDPAFRAAMVEQDILTFLFTPIIIEDFLWGFIGYDDCLQEREWDKDEVDALFTVAKNIAIRVSWDANKAKLLDINEAFELAIQGSKQGLWRWFLKDNTAFFSDYYLKMLGFQKGELMENFEGWLSLIHPEDVEPVLQKQKDYMEGRTADFSLEYRLKHKNGEYRLIYANGKAKHNDEGQLISITGFHVDITEQRKQEITYRLLSENAGDIIALHDLDTKGTVYISAALKEILGYEASEFMGLGLETLIHPEDLQTRVMDQMKGLYKDRKECLLTFRFKHKEGYYLWFESKVKLWTNSLTENSYVQSVSRNITDRIKADEDKALALKRSLELNTLKANFVSMASHQFKTPLTVIYSNMELLEMACANKDNVLAERVSKVSSRIKDEVDRMTDLMNNILIFGSYEAGQTRAKNSKIAIDALLHKINTLYFASEPDGRKLEISIIGNPKAVMGDELLLTHAFSNVLSNAFKYSKGAPSPKMTVNYGPSHVQIEVQDYGLGIPASDLPLLFNSFFRGSNVSTIIGSGLGLPIVKEFIEKHNGSVEVRSTEGIETTVVIQLPYE
jgi:PAS domain S-box-containing protein